MLHVGQHGTTSDHATDSHDGKTRLPDTSQPEGLFTELEYAMNAASSHLLAAETIIDTSSSDGATSDIDCMVCPSIPLL